MAFTKRVLTNENWTLLLGGVSSATFQNSGSFPIYVNFTSANTEPTDTVGLVYAPLTGELKTSLTNLTNVATPSHVWARCLGSQGSVIVEE